MDRKILVLFIVLMFGIVMLFSPRPANSQSGSDNIRLQDLDMIKDGKNGLIIDWLENRYVDYNGSWELFTDVVDLYPNKVSLELTYKGRKITIEPMLEIDGKDVELSAENVHYDIEKKPKKWVFHYSIKIPESETGFDETKQTTKVKYNIISEEKMVPLETGFSFDTIVFDDSLIREEYTEHDTGLPDESKCLAADSKTEECIEYDTIKEKQYFEIHYDTKSDSNVVMEITKDWSDYSVGDWISLDPEFYDNSTNWAQGTFVNTTSSTTNVTLNTNGTCTGTAGLCSSYNATFCPSQQGCSVAAGECSGVCTGLSQATCGVCLPCLWTTSCKGMSPCGEETTEGGCTGLGCACSWTPGACTGTHDACSTYTNQGTCTGNTSCSWIPYKTGTYTSRVFDAASSVNWDNLSWKMDTRDGLAVYDQDTDFDTKYTRLLYGWENENEVAMGASADELWIRLAKHPTKNQVFVAFVDTDSDVNFTVFNNGTWLPGTELETSGVITDRGVDVAYESKRGNATVVYSDSTTTPKYVIWHPGNNSFEAEQSCSAISGTATAESITLIPNPYDNNITLMVGDSSDDVNVQFWNGTKWGTVFEISDACSPGTICYSGVWNDTDHFWAFAFNDTTDIIYYNVWDGTTKSWKYNSPGQALTGDIAVTTTNIWVRAISNKNGEIIVAYSDSDTTEDLNAMVWNGSTWGSETLIEDNLVISGSWGFDLTYMDDRRAMIAYYNNSGGGEANYRIWDGLVWSSTAKSNTPSGAIIWINLIKNPDTEDIMLLMIDTSEDINTEIWDGNSWGTVKELESDSDSTLSEKADFIWLNTTDIYFQVRSDADNSAWGSFLGPDGTANSHYQASNTTLNVSDNRYFQYIAYFETLNTTSPTPVPKLQSVNVTYSSTYVPPDFSVTLPQANCTQGKGSRDAGVTCERCWFEPNASNMVVANALTNSTRIPCEGQSTDDWFYTLTNNGTAPINVSAKLNVTLPTYFRHKVSLITGGYQANCSGNPATGCIFINTTQNYTIKLDLTAGNSIHIWKWADYVDSVFSANIYDTALSFIATTT